MSRKIRKSHHSKTNRYQMVIEHYGGKDCEMTGDLGPKILFCRMNIYSFLILFDTFYQYHIQKAISANCIYRKIH